MNALLFLFSRKLGHFQRTVYLYADYDPEKRDWVELSYGFYLILILAGWTIAMLSWAVFTLGSGLAGLNLPPDTVERLLFFALALWLAFLPLVAYRSTDLHRFELADLDFLANAPLSPALVALAWFARSLFNILPGIFILACGIVASSVSYTQHDNDWLRLGLGFLAGAGFFLVAQTWRWLLGLLRYLPRPLLGPLLGYGLTALGVLLLVLPVAPFLFWPATLASNLLINRATGSSSGLEALLSGLGLLLTAVLLVLALYWLAQSTRLAPALEEGQAGGRLRLANKAGSAVASQARLERHLARRFQQTKTRPSALPDLAGARLVGPEGALLYRQWLRLKRLPLGQLLWDGSRLILLGAGLALALANLTNAAPNFALAVQVAYFGNFGLLRMGVAGLRRELTHPEFFAGWPLDRRRLLAYLLLSGFGLPLLSGEIALLVATPQAAWLLLWPLLLLASAAIVLLDFERKLRKWPATPESVPNTGAGLLLLVGLAWVVTLMFGPSTGLLLAIFIITIYSTFNKSTA